MILVCITMLVDAHCHLSELSQADFDAVMTRSAQNGVSHLVLINADSTPADLKKTLKIAKDHENIVCALAVHPHEAKLVTDESFTELADLIRVESKIRAVGEIGLDYHYMNSEKDEQRAVMRRFVKLANEINKPVIIHDRDAGTECIDILKEENAGVVGGMVHCFTGSMDLAKLYLELGFYVSFTGIITFKKAEELRNVVKMVPLEKMMIETDAPYLAPIPHRGQKNEPGFVKYVAECVAQVKGIAFEEVARKTSENAARFFGF